MKKIKAPDHLSKEAAKIYSDLACEYSIEDVAGLRILEKAGEYFDRAKSASEQIEKDGMTISDKFGQIRPHPLLAAERDARAGFLAALKALNLDLEPIKNIGRPPGR